METPLEVSHASQSRSAKARSLLLGFSIVYSTSSQSSNARWVCCWRKVISMRRRTKWGWRRSVFFPLWSGRPVV